MINQITSKFLNILEIISFDETLFRKEFAKTLEWVSFEDYPIIEAWMCLHKYSEKFPDLVSLLSTKVERGKLHN
jgi:hypothetical protein